MRSALEEGLGTGLVQLLVGLRIKGNHRPGCRRRHGRTARLAEGLEVGPLICPAAGRRRRWRCWHNQRGVAHPGGAILLHLLLLHLLLSFCCLSSRLRLCRCRHNRRCWAIRRRPTAAASRPPARCRGRLCSRGCRACCCCRRSAGPPIRAGLLVGSRWLRVARAAVVPPLCSRLHCWCHRRHGRCWRRSLALLLGRCGAGCRRMLLLLLCWLRRPPLPATSRRLVPHGCRLSDGSDSSRRRPSCNLLAAAAGSRCGLLLVIMLHLLGWRLLLVLLCCSVRCCCRRSPHVLGQHPLCVLQMGQVLASIRL